MDDDSGLREALENLRRDFDGLQARLNAKLFPLPFDNRERDEYTRLATRAWNLLPDELRTEVARHKGQPWKLWTSLAAKLDRSGVRVPSPDDPPVDRTVAAWCGASVRAIDLILAGSPKPPEAGYLGITLDSVELKACRVVGEKKLGPVDFRGKGDQWTLLARLVKAGSDGIRRESASEITDHPDKLKGRLNDSINEGLRLEVNADRNGVWRLTQYGPP